MISAGATGAQARHPHGFVRRYASRYRDVALVRHRGGGSARRLGVVLPAAASLGLLLVVAPPMAKPAAAANIVSAGPLTQINISDRLNCDVRYAGDPFGEWFDEIACGTFVAVGESLFGPADVPAGGSATPRTPYAPVSSALSGAGTVAHPFRSTTVVDLPETALRLTQVDSYIVGRYDYSTTVTITNSSDSDARGIIYTAGDCFLHGADEGFGRNVGTSAFCAESDKPDSRVGGLLPVTPGNHWQEGNYDDIWTQIGLQTHFDDTCECDIEDDNGVGLSWDLTVPAGGSAVYQWRTLFSSVDVRVGASFRPATVNRGAASALDVAVKNAGPFGATDVVLRMVLPRGLSWVTSPVVAGCTPAGQVMTCGIASVPAGDPSYSFIVSTSHAPSSQTEREYEASASVTASNDIDPSNNTANATLRIRAELPVTGTDRRGLSAMGYGAVALLIGVVLVGLSRTRRLPSVTRSCLAVCRLARRRH